MPQKKVKQSVRDFYNAVGWQQVDEGVYQNASFEDLRPVSREYIHKCHMRVNRFFSHQGKYFLDAGSGPIQYPEYLSYSQGYQYRVCVDISIVALREAREKLDEHGLFVVSDIANLPFENDTFQDLVSLHTIHHLPREDYRQAYLELKRVLKKGGTAVVVNGWDSSPIMRFFWRPMLFMERILGNRLNKQQGLENGSGTDEQKPDRTFVHKVDAKNLRILLGSDLLVTIKVWRSVSVRFLRAMIHPFLFGRLWLRILFLAENLFPGFFGEKGQYPLIIFTG